MKLESNFFQQLSAVHPQDPTSGWLSEDPAAGNAREQLQGECAGSPHKPIDGAARFACST